MLKFRSPSEDEKNYVRAITPTIFKQILTIWSCATFITTAVVLILYVILFVVNRQVTSNDLNIITVGAIISLILSLILGTILSPIYHLTINRLRKGDFKVAYGIFKNNSIILPNDALHKYVRLDRDAYTPKQKILVCLSHDKYYTAAANGMVAKDEEIVDD